MLINILTYIVNTACIILGVSATQKFPPPLPKQEESEHFKLAKSGNEESRAKLIEHNLRLVAHIIRKYYSAYKNQDDLISIGSIGLIKAIDSFNCDNGARFATYAAKCIQNEILMYFRSQKKLSYEVSLCETIDVDRDGNPLTYIDIISCDDTIADDLNIKFQTLKAISYIKNQLTEREREIIILRYGLGNSPSITQREVADHLSISRSYVSRIEKTALLKINSYLEGG